MQIDFFSSLIANMETILSNCQQDFALVRSFQHFAIKFLPKKKSRTLKEYFEIFVKLARKMWRFLLELYLAIDPSN